MSLYVDERAQRILEHGRAGRAVLITLVGNYGLPGEMLTVDWCEATQAAHDPDLMQIGVQHGVPVYIYRRIAAYVYWHTLRLTAHRWWRSLAVEHTETVRHDLARWEYTHPGMAGHTPAA